MSKYLLEIGTEELPYKFIPQAVKQLKTSFENFLNTNKIEFGKTDVYATPRRLAIIISDLADSQPDSEKIIKGPIKKVAYDENGNLTQAGQGFLKKNGLTEKDAYIENDYLHAKIFLKGKQVSQVLQENIPELILKMQGSHFMRWSVHEEKFSRPIRWIVSLLNSEELPIQIIDVKSSKITRGHRFSIQELEINNPDEYLEKLKTAHVIADQNERRDIIVKLTKEKADEIGAVASYSDDLLEEVTYLCEYPVPVVCDFDAKYLAIPDEVTVTVMATHQRYFALYKDGKLLNKFITIANYVGNEFSNIKAGNEKVIVARLDDAIFFFNEDTKKPLADYVEKLKGVTFQKGLGSVYDKTMRIRELSKYLAEKLNAPLDTVDRTALLCKADLTTSLVFEFTELQGYIGADYARISNEKEEVANGIKEHYFPLNAESELAEGIEGQIVGIADKVDTVCAVFTGGKIPTGSSDPLGVRRAALGIIKTIINKHLNIDLSELIKKDFELLNAEKIEKVKEFFIQRLVIFMSDSYAKNVLEACSKCDPLKNLCDYVERVEALTEFVKTQNQGLIDSANRVSKLVKDNVSDTVNENLFVQEEEKALYEAVKSIPATLTHKEMIAALDKINPVVVNFFEHVLVMDKDEDVKQNRLAILVNLKKKYETIADFSYLQI
ncbi:MAG: glycine--tRNA ligase subunit beta [Candidatus Melainabacteria bacterium]|nr:MAG: glycine--tRNA ligase subunit beta [Candidatus Melainabacteria bacterium]